MYHIEGLYFPVPGVKIIRSEVPFEIAMELVQSTNIHEALMKELTDDLKLKWQIERWPIDLLRMTGIYSSSNDPMNVRGIMDQVGKRFKPFAQELMGRPDILQRYPKFDLDRWESHLPSVGLRGKIANHIVDGHHRITRAVWRGETHQMVLTAYKPFSISKS